MGRSYKVKVADAEAEAIKRGWRDAHPRIVDYWHELEAAAHEAVAHPGLQTTAGPAGRTIAFRVKGSFLFCRLPSGRVLTYPYPKLKPRETPWGEIREQVHYMNVDGQTGKWVETHTYGGKLSENIVQAISRDLLAEALLRVDAAGYPVVLHVHDEVVSEVHAMTENADAFCALVAHSPAWCPDLPIHVEGWRGKRYRK